MKDRVPTYPGRVKLTPVSGQENTYDMVRADEPTQDGTPLNKASLLKDSTAELFGLDVDALPDDVLNILSNATLLNELKTAISDISGNTVLNLTNIAFFNALKTAIVDRDGTEMLQIPGVQMAAGTYKGTGTYGENNPNSLTFEFEPMLVIVTSYRFYTGDPSIQDSNISVLIPNYGMTVSYSNTRGVTEHPYIGMGRNVVSVVGNTMSWYASRPVRCYQYGNYAIFNTDSKIAMYQMNDDGTTYNYLAIGIKR